MPLVNDWLIKRNCTKEPPLEIGGREFSTAHHAALECVCRVVDGVSSETRPIANYKFNRRCFDGWNWEKLQIRITCEWRRAVEELPDGEQQSANSNGSSLKTGLPPDGWHPTPLCGTLKKLAEWENTSTVTLKVHNQKGVRWRIVPWGGKDDETGWLTPFAIYYPSIEKFGTANKRRLIDVKKRLVEIEKKKQQEIASNQNKSKADRPKVKRK